MSYYLNLLTNLRFYSKPNDCTFKGTAVFVCVFGEQAGRVRRVGVRDVPVVGLSTGQAGP